MEGYRKLNILRDLWKNPQNHELTPTQKMIIQKLKSFIQRSQAYNGKIICGDHGVGKTFTIRYFLSKLGYLDDIHYLNVNGTVLEEVKRKDVSLRQKNELFKIIKSLLRDAKPVLVLDACEVLSFLGLSQRMEFIRDIRYRRTKTILVLPTELNPKIPSITIGFPSPTTEDCEVFFRNLKTKVEVPSFSVPFTRLISMVV